jgi:hypothetical protein
MRSAALGVVLLVATAIALGGVQARPTDARPGALTLSVERPQYEIPSGRLNTWVQIRFYLAGLNGRRTEAWHCRNGHFDRSKLRYSWPPCSSGDSVFGQPTGEDSWVDEFDNAGRYESFVRTNDEISNFVTFTVLDECGWVVVRDQQWIGHSEPGMPYHCNHLRSGPLELRAADGSRLVSSGVGSAMRNRFYPNRLSQPDLRIGVGEAFDNHTRPVGSLRLLLGPVIGGFLVHVHTPAGMVMTFGRADFSISHQRRVTKVRVYAGKVVVLGYTFEEDIGDWVQVACHRRVSLRCLTRMPRSLVLRRGRSIRIRQR